LLNGEFATRQYIDHYFRENGVAPRLAMEVNSISAVIEVVSRSALATLLPAAITRQHHELCSVQLEPALPQRTAALLLRKSGYRSRRHGLSWLYRRCKAMPSVSLGSGSPGANVLVPSDGSPLMEVGSTFRRQCDEGRSGGFKLRRLTKALSKLLFAYNLQNVCIESDDDQAVGSGYQSA